MTLMELSVGLSTITGAVGGGMAGARAGFLGGAAGAAAGAFVGAIATVLVVGVTGVTAVALGRFEESPPRRPPGRLSEFAFFLFVSPVAFAPVWVPLLTYRLVGLIAGGG